VRGWVLEATDDVPSRTLSVKKVVSPVRFFDRDMLGLARWVSERYVAPLAAVLGRLSPPRVASEERADAQRGGGGGAQRGGGGGGDGVGDPRGVRGSGGAVPGRVEAGPVSDVARHRLRVLRRRRRDSLRGRRTCRRSRSDRRLARVAPGTPRGPRPLLPRERR